MTPRTTNRSRGFTLVSLLVVVVILGAVSAAAVVSVNRMTVRSQRAVCATDAHMIRTAVATDRAQHGAADAPTMAALVARGLLERPSAYHSISYSGTALELRDLGACAGDSGT
jgi:type II secretory pathway pseudopilin PulG